MKKDHSDKKKLEESKAEERITEHSCEDKLEELTDLLKRTQAEFENYKKRIDSEKQQYLKYASSLVLAKLLPLLDTFDSAIKNNNNRNVIEAIELIKIKFNSILKNEGIMPIQSIGSHFDPFKHEAVMIEETNEPEKDNIVVEELQKGYMLHDKVLRHSKVKVAKYKAGASQTNGTQNLH